MSAAAALLLVALGQPSPAADGDVEPDARAVAVMRAPGLRAASADEIASGRAALHALDLAELERVRAAAVERGVDVSTGELAALHDLSRLLRCLPVPPVPAHESPRLLGPRLLLRLEALRVLRRRTEGAYSEDTDIQRMLGLATTWASPAPGASPAWVSWPLSTERWPDEVIEPALEPSVCATPARRTKRDRARVEGARAADLIALGPELPPTLRTRVLLLALARGAPLSTTASVAAWLDGGEPALVPPATLRLARRAEVLGALPEAIALHQRVLADPQRTDAEDGWARARLVGLLEDPAAILEVTRAARAPRPQDAAALAHAEARALYARGDLDGLERFGRGWLARRGPPDALGFDQATEDLLVALALVRPPDRAVAWTESLGPSSERDTRLDRLAQRAIEVGQLDLAAYVYDQLRREAAADRTRGGAPAVARLTRWLGGRAHVEHARGDPEAFADFVAELEHIASDEGDRPLARTAPHRAVAVLCQVVLGPLTEARSQDSTRAFAGIMVKAIDKLTITPTRWSRTLVGYRGPLAELAGVGALAFKGKRPPPAIRSVGVVTLPRLAPRLPAPDEPTPLPPIGSFWVRPAEREHDTSGGWVAGPPWPPPPPR